MSRMPDRRVRRAWAQVVVALVTAPARFRTVAVARRRALRVRMPQMRRLPGIVALTVLCCACGDDGGAATEPSGVYALEAPDGCFIVYSFRPKEGLELPRFGGQI
jgi:hypothetical protein